MEPYWCNFNANFLNLEIDAKGRFCTRDDKSLTMIAGIIPNLTISKKDAPDEIFLHLKNISNVSLRFNLEEKKLTVIELNGEIADVYSLNGNGLLELNEDDIKLCFEDMAIILGDDLRASDLTAAKFKFDGKKVTIS